MRQGPLIILSGPSGSGKSTVMARIRETSDLPIRQSISATTRPPRPYERHGVDYYFLTPDAFAAMLRDGELLEWAQVHGHYYGTPRAPIDALRGQGFGVVLVIDVQGAAQVRRLCPDHVSIFLRTSSLDILERRLRERHTEDEASLRQRLDNARVELQQASEYQHQVINDELDTAVRQVVEIIRNQFS